jgi:hypothetical protein
MDRIVDAIADNLDEPPLPRHKTTLEPITPTPYMSIPMRYEIFPSHPEAHLFEVRCTVADPDPGKLY